MDTDQNGTITIDELRRGLREQGSTVSEEELDTLVRPAGDLVPVRLLLTWRAGLHTTHM